MKNTKLYRSWEKLRNDLAPMTFSQKLDHIWTYYKEHMFVAALVTVVLVGVVCMFVNAARESYLTGLLCNVSMSQEGHSYLVEDYASRHPEVGNREVSLGNTIFEDLETVSQVDSNYQAAMGVIGQIEAKRLDYLIMDQVGLNFYGGQEILMDVRDFLTEEELILWQDKLVFVRFEDENGESEGDKLALALDVTELPFVKACVRTGDKVYLGFAGNLPRPAETRQFWEDLLAWEKGV